MLANIKIRASLISCTLVKLRAISCYEKKCNLKVYYISPELHGVQEGHIKSVATDVRIIKISTSHCISTKLKFSLSIAQTVRNKRLLNLKYFTPSSLLPTQLKET
jgi:hypothetical protein